MQTPMRAWAGPASHPVRTDFLHHSIGACSSAGLLPLESPTSHLTSVHPLNRLNSLSRPTIVLRMLPRGYPPHARRVNSAGGCGNASDPKVKGASIALGGRRLSR